MALIFLFLMIAQIKNDCDLTILKDYKLFEYSVFSNNFNGLTDYKYLNFTFEKNNEGYEATDVIPENTIHIIRCKNGKYVRHPLQAYYEYISFKCVNSVLFLMSVSSKIESEKIVFSESATLFVGNIDCTDNVDDQTWCHVPEDIKGVETHVAPFYTVQAWIKNSGLYNSFFRCNNGFLDFEKIKIAEQSCNVDDEYFYFNNYYMKKVDFVLPPENICVKISSETIIQVNDILIESVASLEKLINKDTNIAYVDAGEVIEAQCQRSRYSIEIYFDLFSNILHDEQFITTTNIENYCENYCVIRNGNDLFNVEFIFEDDPKAVSCKNGGIILTKEKESFHALKLFCKTQRIYYLNEENEKIAVKRDTLHCEDKKKNDYCPKIADLDSISIDTNRNYVAAKAQESFKLVCDKNEFVSVTLYCDLTTPPTKDNIKDVCQECVGVHEQLSNLKRKFPDIFSNHRLAIFKPGYTSVECANKDEKISEGDLLLNHAIIRCNKGNINPSVGFNCENTKLSCPLVRIFTVESLETIFYQSHILRNKHSANLKCLKRKKSFTVECKEGIMFIDNKEVDTKVNPCVDQHVVLPSEDAEITIANLYIAVILMVVYSVLFTVVLFVLRKYL